MGFLLDERVHHDRFVCHLICQPAEKRLLVRWRYGVESEPRHAVSLPPVVH